MHFLPYCCYYLLEQANAGIQSITVFSPVLTFSIRLTVDLAFSDHFSWSCVT